MNHTWITIAEFPQYQINENGTVRHSITLNERKATVGKRGYWVISFKKNGKFYLRTLHRLLAIAFIPNPENKREINHIDGNKLNCSLDNLEWVTPQENIIHARVTGLHISDGDKKVGQYLNGELICVFKSASEASRVLSISRGNICSCARGNTRLKTYKGYEWKYL